ncbi:MAG: CHAT domain-containing protein [Actinomycetes bacterium]
MLTPEELHARARTATNAGRHVHAATLLRRALTLPCETPLRARLLTTLAYAEVELGHLELAESLCDEALALGGLDAETRGVIHGQRGVVALRRGNRDRALADFGAAIRSLAKDHAALGRNLLNRGNLYLETGHARRALADFERAVVESEFAGPDAAGQAAKARHNAGYAHFLLGDIVRALRAMDTVSEYLSKQSHTSLAVCLQDRAEVLAAAGLITQAVADLRRAIEEFHAGGARRAEASAMLVLARLLITEDPEAGLALARRASRRFTAMGADLARLSAEAVVAISLRAAGRTTVPEAEALAMELRQRGLHDDADQLTVAACGWLVANGRLDEARTVPLPRSAPLRTRLWTAYVAATRDAALGRRARALDRLRHALDSAHSLKASLGSLELQTSSTRGLATVGQFGLTLALQRRNPELVLEWSERARAASSRVMAVRPPDDAEQAADLAELRSLVLFGGDPARQRVLRQRIRERAWRDHGSGATQPVASLADTTAALGRRDAVLVALVANAESVNALVADAAGAAVIEVAPLDAVTTLLGGLPADLDVTATDLPSHLARTVRAGLDARLGALDELLLRPLAERIAGRRVVLTPSGIFAHLPWPLLATLSGVPVTVASSATAWVAATASPSGPLRRPTFLAGPRLRRAEEEVAACAAHWPEAAVLAGEDATVGAAFDVAERTDVFHVAAHGHHHAENPLFSHVELLEGPVFGYELSRISALPPVVILSSCDLGTRTSSDDPLGLVTALLHGGVQTVLASPAALSDHAASRLMPDLHARLAAGTSPADALAGSVAAFGPDAPPLVCFGAGW